MSCSGRRRSGKRNLGHGATGRPGPAQRHSRRKQPGRSAGQSERHETGAVGVPRFRLECVYSVPMPACIGVVLFARSARHVSAQARRWHTFVTLVFSQHTYQVLAF
jgi:hypothetical protein